MLMVVQLEVKHIMRDFKSNKNVKHQKAINSPLFPIGWYNWCSNMDNLRLSYMTITSLTYKILKNVSYHSDQSTPCKQWKQQSHTSHKITNSNVYCSHIQISTPSLLRYPYFFFAEYMSEGGDEELPLGAEFQDHMACFIDHTQATIALQYAAANKLIQQLR